MSEKSCDTRCSMSSSLGLLVLRLVAGASLAMHGWAKLHEPLHTEFFDGVSHMGAPFESSPKLFAYASVAAELGGGILLAVGGLTRLAAFLILCNFAVAIWKVHLHDPFVSAGGKAMEPATIYAAIAFAFLLAGAGRISVDGMLFCRGKSNNEEPPADEEKF